jgi:hypothetical protein
VFKQSLEERGVEVLDTVLTITIILFLLHLLALLRAIRLQLRSTSCADTMIYMSSLLCVCRGFAPNMTAVAIPIAVTIFTTDLFVNIKTAGTS